MERWRKQTCIRRGIAMDFNEYQRMAKMTDVYSKNIAEGYEGEDIKAKYRLYYTLFGLCSEVGELQGKIKKIIRKDEPGKCYLDEIQKEIGDIMWYIAQICTELGLSMHGVAKQNINKLFSRMQRGEIKGDGDNR